MKVSDNDYQKAIEKYVSLEDNETKLMIETSIKNNMKQDEYLSKHQFYIGKDKKEEFENILNSFL